MFVYKALRNSCQKFTQVRTEPAQNYCDAFHHETPLQTCSLSLSDRHMNGLSLLLCIETHRSNMVASVGIAFVVGFSKIQT